MFVYILSKNQHHRRRSSSATSIFAFIASRSRLQQDNYFSHRKNNISAKRALMRIRTHHQHSTAHRRFHALKAVTRSKRFRLYTIRSLPSSVIAPKRFTSIGIAHLRRCSSNVHCGTEPRFVRVLPAGALSLTVSGASSRRSSSRSTSDRSLFAVSGVTFPDNVIFLQICERCFYERQRSFDNS